MAQGIDIAASVVIGCLDDLVPGPRPLVIDEETGALAGVFEARGHAVAEWRRRASPAGPGQCWPAAGPFTSAFLRLPKAKDALDFALHAATSAVAPGAPIVLFGANDEGARSAAAHLAAVVDDVTTIATKRHCRVMAGRAETEIVGHKSSLAAWRATREIRLPGKRRQWVTYPGVFARGGLDEGTALLLANLPQLTPRAKVLDFAAGTGVIAAAVLQSVPGIAVDLLEIDALALAAARENVPAARPIAGFSLQAAGETRYDAILSNPPVHDGIEDDLGVLAALIAAAPKHLAWGGELRIVVQRRVVAAPLLEQAFGNVTRIAVTGAFQVLQALRTRTSRGRGASG